MAYNKKNWQDNVSDITAAELNRMEQGIYDNSLVVDAVTNTLNPTDTETYKTAELTEGQITDVIGVNDIIIKGQTSQNGEPTPDSPVDVNVVSGSNVVNTSNKNLLNINNAIAFRACTIQLQNNSIKIITDGTNNAIVKIPCVLTAGDYYLHFEGNANIINIAFYNSNGEKIIANNPSSSRPITLSDNLAYIQINLSNVAGTYSLAFNKLYINLGSIDLGYEPHQGKELPLDLPVENLFMLPEAETKNGITYSKNEDGTINIKGTATSTTYFSLYVDLSDTKFKNSKAYTFSSNKPITSGLDFRCEAYNEASWIKHIVPPIDTTHQKNTTNSLDLSTANRVRFSIVINSGTTVNSSNIGIQLEQSSSANAYTPFGTEPIELCKIGNYQDYFYKSGSKWYLHKEIERLILGDYNWTLANNTSISNINTNRWYIAHSCSRLPNNNAKVIMSNILPMGTANSTYGQDELLIGQSTSQTIIRMPVEYTTASAIKTALQDISAYAYVLKNEATDAKITDTTLISQLEAIYNAPLYAQTNITQTNNDLPMVLDITACKDNINGIKAFIRK